MGINQRGQAPRQRCRGPRDQISLLEPATGLDIIEQTGSLRDDAASRHAAPGHRARSSRGLPPGRPGHAHRPNRRGRRDRPAPPGRPDRPDRPDRPARPRWGRGLVVAFAAAGLIVAIPLAVYFAAVNSPLGGSVTPCNVCQLAIPSSGPVPNVPGPSATARPAKVHRSVPGEMATVSQLVATPASTPSATTPPPPPGAYFPWYWTGWWRRGFGGYGGQGGGFGGYGGGFGGGGGFGYGGGFGSGGFGDGGFRGR